MNNEVNFYYGESEGYDASDEEAVEDAAKKSESREKVIKWFNETIMSTYEGRRWLWEKMLLCNIHGNAVVPGDIQATYFNLGMENVGKTFLIEAMLYPKLYMQMAEEAQERGINGI